MHINRRRTLLFFVVCAWFLQLSCSLPPTERPALHLRDHPLAGRIWDAQRGAFIAEEQALRVLERSRYLLLGEMHENDEHHRLTARILEHLGRAGLLSSLSLEIFSAEDQALLARLDALPHMEARDVLKEAKLDYHGSFPLADYADIIAEALRWKAAVCPADVNPTLLRKLRGPGVLQAQIPAPRLAALGLLKPLQGAENRSLMKRLSESHCGHVPEQALQPMADVQRLRDALMADSLLSCSSAPVRVLLAGAQHVRLDSGAPLYLRKRNAHGIVSLSFQEVAADKNDPSDYLDGHAEFDLLWFTPRFSLADPCARFEEQLKRLRKDRRNSM